MTKNFVTICLELAAIWSGVMLGYYALLPLLGVELGYNTAPIAISVYYLVWIGIAFLALKDSFGLHVPNVRSVIADGLLGIVFGVIAGSVLWLLYASPVPLVPAQEPMTDLLLSTPWYFVPKSFEIALQQMLIAALVFELARLSYSLRQIILFYAIAFGGMHLLLFFGGTFPPAVLIMTLSAVVSATIFPFLLLRVKHGFLITYMLHWGFYAGLALLLRSVG